MYRIIWRRRGHSEVEMRWYGRKNISEHYALYGTLIMESERGYQFMDWVSSKGVDILESPMGRVTADD